MKRKEGRENKIFVNSRRLVNTQIFFVKLINIQKKFDAEFETIILYQGSTLSFLTLTFQTISNSKHNIIANSTLESPQESQEIH